jgi:hypothetical protein
MTEWEILITPTEDGYHMEAKADNPDSALIADRVSDLLDDCLTRLLDRS